MIKLRINYVFNFSIVFEPKFNFFEILNSTFTNINSEHPPGTDFVKNFSRQILVIR